MLTMYKRFLVLFLMLKSTLFWAQGAKTISPLSGTASPPSPSTSYRALPIALTSSPANVSLTTFERQKANVERKCEQALHAKRDQLELKSNQAAEQQSKPKSLQPNMTRINIAGLPKENAEDAESAKDKLRKYVCDCKSSLEQEIKLRKLDAVKNQLLALGVQYKNPVSERNRQELVIDTMHKYLPQLPQLLTSCYPKKFKKRVIRQTIHSIFENKLLILPDDLNAALGDFKTIASEIWAPTCGDHLKFYLCCCECMPIRVAPDKE